MLDNIMFVMILIITVVGLGALILAIGAGKAHPEEDDDYEEYLCSANIEDLSVEDFEDETGFESDFSDEKEDDDESNFSSENFF